MFKSYMPLKLGLYQKHQREEKDRKKPSCQISQVFYFSQGNLKKKTNYQNLIKFGALTASVGGKTSFLKRLT